LNEGASRKSIGGKAGAREKWGILETTVWDSTGVDAGGFAAKNAPKQAETGVCVGETYVVE